MAPEYLESDYDEDDLYQMENMSIDDNREKLNYGSVHLNKKAHMWLKIEMTWYLYMVSK